MKTLLIISLLTAFIYPQQNSQIDKFSSFPMNTETIEDEYNGDCEHSYSSINSISPNAEGGPLLSLPSCYHYFKNLTYFGLNERGSCGYLAASMLLNYFDTFKNDNIVPDSYERITESYDYTLSSEYTLSHAMDYRTYEFSPGTYTEPVVGNEYSIETYLAFVNEWEQNFYCHLHYNLINDYHERYYEAGDQDLGLTIGEIAEIIDLYLTSKSFVKNVDYTIDLNYYNIAEYTTEKNGFIRNKIINYVQAVIPVIAGVSISDIAFTGLNFGDSKHAVIYHHYDTSTNNLIGHFGFFPENKYRTEVDETLYYGTKYLSCLAVNFIGEHVHSNNYAVMKNGTVDFYICPCGEYDTHTHRYSTFYNSNDNYHTAYCDVCSYEFIDRHRYSQNTNSCICGDPYGE